MVLLIIRIVRRMTRSTLIGAIAGILLIVDGVTFVSSRLGMLDIFLAFFVLAALGCLVVDRDQVRERMAKVYEEGRIGDSAWGPRLGFRWWRFGAGILLGLACGTKWSGMYFILFFGLLSVAFDLSARRAYPRAAPMGRHCSSRHRAGSVCVGDHSARCVPRELLGLVHQRDRRRPSRRRERDR